MIGPGAKRPSSRSAGVGALDPLPQKARRPPCQGGLEPDVHQEEPNPLKSSLVQGGRCFHFNIELQLGMKKFSQGRQE